MMESDIFLFSKPLLMVAIMSKYFQCTTRLIFKSIWCYSSDFKHIESATGHAQGIFVKSACVGERKFLREIKLYNRIIVDTQSSDPILFLFSVTTISSIMFTGNSDHCQSVQGIFVKSACVGERKFLCEIKAL